MEKKERKINREYTEWLLGMEVLAKDGAQDSVVAPTAAALRYLEP